MLKRLLLTTAAMGLLIGTAAAADLPSRAAPPVYVAPPPVFSWSGFYAGINGGYSWSTKDFETTTSDGSAVAQGQLNAGTVPTGHALDRDGGIAGGQIGYNYEFGAGPAGGVVVGLEADADWSDAEHNDLQPSAFNTSNQYHSRLDYLGTVRGRLGYAVDRALFYATGGFAYGESQYAHTYYSNTATPFPIFGGNSSGMQTGYAGGGGIEYAFPADRVLNFLGSNALTLKVEYLYYDLGSRTTALPGQLAAIAGDSLFDHSQTAGNLVRAGINFKFGTPAPVVARY